MDAQSQERIFITGSTGFVGKYLLRRLAREDHSRIFYLLVRGSKAETAIERMENMLQEVFTNDEYAVFRKRFNVVEGELTEERFGLPDKSFAVLASQVNVIYHSAATIKFNLTYEEAHHINVGGTREVLRLSELCHRLGNLRRHSHISTAFVDGIANPGYEGMGNTYEATKKVAEGFVQQAIDAGLPITIYRPSIVIGDSISGELSDTSVLFKFFVMYSREFLSILPCSPDAGVNLVPVNDFIDAMLEIGSKPEAVGKCYVIASSENTNFIELAREMCRTIGKPMPQVADAGQASALPKRIYEQLAYFLHYIEASHRFDISETLSFLNKDIFPPKPALTAIEPIAKWCMAQQMFSALSINK